MVPLLLWHHLVEPLEEPGALPDHDVLGLHLAVGFLRPHQVEVALYPNDGDRDLLDVYDGLHSLLQKVTLLSFEGDRGLFKELVALLIQLYLGQLEELFVEFRLKLLLEILLFLVFLNLIYIMLFLLVVSIFTW